MIQGPSLVTRQRQSLASLPVSPNIIIPQALCSGMGSLTPTALFLHL